MFFKKKEKDFIQKEFEYLDLLNAKVNLYENLKRSVTRFEPLYGKEYTLLSEEWMISKIFGIEFLNEYKRNLGIDNLKQKEN